jgi:hypothetical protein
MPSERWALAQTREALDQPVTLRTVFAVNLFSRSPHLHQVCTAALSRQMENDRSMAKSSV